MNILKQLCSMPFQLAPLQCQQTNQFSTTAALHKSVARKFINRSYRFLQRKRQVLTYEMYRRPHHLGVDKAWMTWNTTNLFDFRKNQGVTIAQDEVIRRFVRAIFHNHLPLTLGGTELVIKRRGNVAYVSGFLVPKDYTRIEQVYWMWGFTEEILSNLLKQPVKLELQFVRSVEDLAYSHWEPKITK